MTVDDDRKARAGALIRKQREALKLTQTQLAGLLGPSCTASLVSNWERGISYPEDYQDQLCAALSITLDQIRHGSAIPVVGVVNVKNQTLKRVLESPEWAALPVEKQSALATLFNDIDVEEYEVRSAMAVLLRGQQSKKRR